MSRAFAGLRIAWAPLEATCRPTARPRSRRMGRSAVMSDRVRRNGGSAADAAASAAGSAADTDIAGAAPGAIGADAVVASSGAAGAAAAADERAREYATDPRRSILLQAPAGSGKTTVLTQRLLRLLAVVDEPEEILAITFTRK